MERIILTAKPTDDYELIDSGQEEKLERYAEVILVRPDPQALWERSLGEGEWDKADARYTREGKGGGWEVRSGATPATSWPICYGGFTFSIKPTSFKHTGLFPEQISNWEWIKKTLSQEHYRNPPEKVLGKDPFIQNFSGVPKVLNLFSYTGGATLAAAQAGAQVTHVDASKIAVSWARENAQLSLLADKPIRWIIEDVMLFVRREIKRGNKYDAIIMDPPAFGHGPNDELWKIEENFLTLMQLCEELLSDNPLFVLISGYAAGYSPLAFAYNLDRFEKKYGGSIEYGDLCIEQKNSPRVLPCGIFARWNR